MTGFHTMSRRETRMVEAFLDPTPMPIRPSGSPITLPMEVSHIMFPIIDDGHGFQLVHGYRVRVNNRVNAHPDHHNQPLTELVEQLAKEYCAQYGLRTNM